MANTVIEALRGFLPAYRAGAPVLSRDQRRALWAITRCRTPAMGGRFYGCDQCGTREFAYHSCNHRSCPQCGRAATAKWVGRELEKRIGAPYFMVTFTLPAELRALFFGPQAKEIYDLFFAATSSALREKLAARKWLGACLSGFTAILHTWNQRLHFHPHLHYLVPGAGLDSAGRVVTVKNANFLVPLPVLSRAFRKRLLEMLEAAGHNFDPTVIEKDWGVHIQPFGSGANAIKYLGTYVCRTAIADSRILRLSEHEVTFRWKDREHGERRRADTIPGVEFVARYLRHVLPRGLRAIRRFGFCHPAAKKTRERIAFHTGRPLLVAAALEEPASDTPSTAATPLCPCCRQPMTLLRNVAPLHLIPRAPPREHKLRCAS